MVAGVKDHVSYPQAAVLNLSSLPRPPTPTYCYLPCSLFHREGGAGIGVFLQLPFFCLLLSSVCAKGMFFSSPLKTCYDCSVCRQFSIEF